MLAYQVQHIALSANLLTGLWTTLGQRTMDIMYKYICVATLVKRKSWKAMMDSGRDPREGIFPSL